MQNKNQKTIKLFQGQKKWLVNVITILLLNQILVAQVGYLDHTFGNNGIVNPSNGDEGGVNHHIYFDDKILQLSNFYKDGFTGGILLIKYNSDGSMDNSFGVEGVIRDSLTEFPVMWGYELIVQSDGTILISGGRMGMSADFLLMKFNDDGSRDDTFGDNGVAISPYGYFLYPFGYGMAVQPDGKIIVTGNDSGEFATLRFNTNGTLDSTFGNEGGIICGFPGNASDFSFDAEMLSDNRIIVSGFTSSSTNIPAVACLTSDGILDPSFGTGGKVHLDTYPAKTFGLLVQPDDKIVLPGDNKSFRLNSDGSLDPSFGNAGIANVSVPSGFDYITFKNICKQNDGRILLAGEVGHNGTYTSDLILVRLTSEGQPDMSFGNNGIGELIHISPSNNIGYSVSTQSNNKIIATGSLLYSDNTERVLIARYQNEIVSGLGNLSASPALSIFPNPVSGSLQIEIDSGLIGPLEIISTDGKVVRSIDVRDKKAVIDIHQLNQGIYIIKPERMGDFKQTVFIKN